jgi:hypothetical protein
MQTGATHVYYDEEDCLGFDVFVAELELIVGLKKDTKPDGVQLLELLQKLIPSIERASKPTLKQYQRRCESVLFDVLLKGICSAVMCLRHAPTPHSVRQPMLHAGPEAHLHLPVQIVHSGRPSPDVLPGELVASLPEQQGGHKQGNI